MASRQILYFPDEPRVRASRPGPPSPGCRTRSAGSGGSRCSVGLVCRCKLTPAGPGRKPEQFVGTAAFGRFSRLWRASHPPAHPAVVVTVVFRSPARRCHAASVWPTPSGSMRGGPEAPGAGRTMPLGRGELAIHRPRVFALSLVPRPRMTCSFSGRRKRPPRRAFVVLCAIRARPEDLISLTGLLPIWLPKRALPTGVTVSWCGQIRCDLHGLHRRRSGTPSGGRYAMAGGQRSS
jgi:hypothetical protein